MKKALILLAIGSIAISVAFGQLGGFPIPDSSFYANAQEIQAMHNALDTQQLQAYKSIRLLDLVYPLFYGLFFILAIYALAKRVCIRQWTYRALPFFPAIAMMADYKENILLMLALRVMPEINWAASLAGFCTSAKWVSLLASLLICFALLIRQIHLFVRAKCIRCGP